MWGFELLILLKKAKQSVDGSPYNKQDPHTHTDAGRIGNLFIPTLGGLRPPWVQDPALSVHSRRHHRVSTLFRAVAAPAPEQKQTL
jgi:hypothetical protein